MPHPQAEREVVQRPGLYTRLGTLIKWATAGSVGIMLVKLVMRGLNQLRKLMVLPAPQPVASVGGAPQAPVKLSFSSTVLVVVLPAILSAVLTNAQVNFPVWAQSFVSFLRQLVNGKIYTRTVEFKTKYNQWGYQMSDSHSDHRNNFLQKAVTLKVASRKDYGFETAQVFQQQRLPQSIYT